MDERQKKGKEIMEGKEERKEGKKKQSRKEMKTRLTCNHLCSLSSSTSPQSSIVNVVTALICKQKYTTSNFETFKRPS